MKLEAYQYDESKYETFLNSVSEELKYAYIEGYHSEQKKIQNVELFCRSFVEFKNCRRFFSHFCRNKNVVLTL